MAALQKLRNNAGVLIAAVIGFALLAFILGDLLSAGNTLFGGNKMEIAEISGNSISYQDYQKQFDELSEVYKMNSGQKNIDENTYQQLQNQTWDAVVQENVMTKVYEKLGIDVSADELFDMVQGKNIHPIIDQLFRDQNTGTLNKTQVIQFLKYIEANPTAEQAKYWLFIEKQILTEKKSSKYNDLVGKGLYVNSLQASQSLKEKSKKVSLKYITKSYAEIPDNSVNVSESELKDYYNNHEDEFKLNKSRKLVYVTFDVKPSSDDDANVQKWINEIKPSFITSTDNAQFANSNSETRFEEDFVKPEQLPSSIVTWASMAAVNDVYGPYKEGATYKLAKVNAFKMLPDSVEARHILIKPTSQEAVAGVQKTIDSLKTLIERGADFSYLASKYSEDKGSAIKGGDLGWFKKGMMVKPFETAAFNANEKELSIAMSQFGIHLIQTMKKGKTSQHIQIAYIDRTVVASNRTIQDTYAEANKFASKAQDLAGFDKVVAEMKLDKKSTAVQEVDRSITGLGMARQFVRAAFFDSKVGQLVMSGEKSPVFELENKFIVAAIVSEQKDGVQELAVVRPRVELAVRKIKKEEMLAKQFSGAKSSSIEEMGSKLGLTVGAAQDIALNMGTITGIGYEPAVIGAALSLNANQISAPIIGKNGVFAIYLTNVTESPLGDVNEEKQNLSRGLSYRASYQAFTTLKDNADIVDKRSTFY